jgi:hypothetical protein
LYRLAVFVALALALATSATPALAEPVSGVTPTFVSIPMIGTAARVVPLGLIEDGSLDAPEDPDTVGWFELGAGIGAPGNVILDGHIDWGGRLRVFGLLRTLLPGDRVQVTGSDQVTRTYGVTWSRLFDAENAPLDEIYELTDEIEEVTLITCGGVFDPAERMYVGRLVVRAVLTAD